MVKNIKIGNYVYKVVELEETLGGEQWGQIDNSILEIQINKNLDERVKYSTLLHECVHGILTRSDIRKHNEIVIQVVANGIEDLIVNNPTLVKNIQKLYKEEK